MVMVGLPSGGCRDDVSTPTNPPTLWEPSLAQFANYPYSRIFTVTDPSGDHRFSIDVRALVPETLSQVRPEAFAIELADDDTAIIPAEDHGGGVDGVVEGTGLDRGSVPTGPPPLFVKIAYQGDRPAPRVILQLRGLPRRDYGVVITAGHYQSIVLRRPNATRWSYVTFYHHHGDWNEHVLYQGWFYRCTYAYDCNPNHGISSWRTTYYDEQVEFRGDCYGRCP